MINPPQALKILPLGITEVMRENANVSLMNKMNKCKIILILCFLFSQSWSIAKDAARIPNLKSYGWNPIISIYNENSWQDTPTIVLLVFDSGKFVWSADQKKGGPPYFFGESPKPLFVKLLQDIKNFKIGKNKELQDGGLIVVDGNYTTVCIVCQKSTFQTRTSHELYPGAPDSQRDNDFEREWKDLKTLIYKHLPKKQYKMTNPKFEWKTLK